MVHEAPLLIGLYKQENHSWLPFPSPGDLPESGMETLSPVFLALQADFFTC